VCYMLNMSVLKTMYYVHDWNKICSVLFECSCYIHLRLQYIHVFVTTRPNMYKLTLLFRSKNEIVLLNWSKFIYHAIRIRTQHCLVNLFLILSSVWILSCFLFLCYIDQLIEYTLLCSFCTCTCLFDILIL